MEELRNRLVLLQSFVYKHQGHIRLSADDELANQIVKCRLEIMSIRKMLRS